MIYYKHMGDTPDTAVDKVIVQASQYIAPGRYVSVHLSYNNHVPAVFSTEYFAARKQTAITITRDK